MERGKGLLLALPSNFLNGPSGYKMRLFAMLCSATVALGLSGWTSGELAHARDLLSESVQSWALAQIGRQKFDS